MLKRLTLFLLLLLTTAPSPQARGVIGKDVTERDVSEVLKTLDKEINRSVIYIRLRHQRIDSLQRLLASAEKPDTATLSLLMRIGDNYNAFNTDSALLCYERGIREARLLGADSTEFIFACRKAKVLPLLLFFAESDRLLDSIRGCDVPPGLMAEKYEAERQSQFYMANFFTSFPTRYDSISAKVNEAQSKLLQHLPEGTPIYKLMVAEHLFQRLEFDKAAGILAELVETVPDDSPIYARACHLVAEIAKKHGDIEAQVYYLALSSISDIRCATLEVASIQELGRLLYELDDIERAHDYLSSAMRNAVSCQALLRIIQTSQSIPIIEDAHKMQLMSQKTGIYTVIGVLAVFLVILFVATRYAHQRNRKLRQATERLKVANDTKDIYLSQFLNLCSIYMDKLHQFNKVVNRKISAGQTEELYRMTKSGRFMEDEAKEFYAVIDDAFLHLYPNFVEEVNRLLLPDKQIVLKDGEKLNTDLRILALSILGVDDTARLAQMLGYSVYTIYTYRNKFKARVRNRDTFDEDLRAIRSRYVGEPEDEGTDNS